MNRRLSAGDVRAVHRFVDGAMSNREALEFGRRLANEPDLRRELQEVRSVSAAFAAGRATGIQAPPDFTRKLMRAVQQTATDPSWRQHVLDDGQVVRWTYHLRPRKCCRCTLTAPSAAPSARKRDTRTR